MVSETSKIRDYKAVSKLPLLLTHFKYRSEMPYSFKKPLYMMMKE